MLTIEADIYEYVRMSYVDKNILGPLVHMQSLAKSGESKKWISGDFVFSYFSPQATH